jgi:ATP-dependent DNA helicase RecG
MDPLQTPIAYLKGVGPSRATLLQSELGIHTFQDLLHCFPHRYIDRSTTFSIANLPQNNAEVQLIGRITDLQIIPQKRGKRLSVQVEDGSGTLELVWFRGYKWIMEGLRKNEPYVIFGRLNWFNGRVSIPHPELELLSQFEKGPKIALKPLYPSTEKLTTRGVSQRIMQKMMTELMKATQSGFTESLSLTIIEQWQLMPKKDALFQIHFPQSHNALSKAQFRLKFEELFYIQLQLLKKNLDRKQKIKGYRFSTVGDHFNQFYNEVLPFDLTDAQKKVLKEIRTDMGTGAQMNRLLQGDVGSGKTIVALMAILLALDNGYQGCIMAPTEILAQQHYQSIERLLKKMDIRLGLLTGSVKEKERKPLLEQLAQGELQILVGTHALLEDRVKFKNLGLVIIDEQHRFGVAQRAKLWKKNTLPPHVLVMTATPIPRTLAMSLYGDLDQSVIDELPPGRKPVKTVHRTDKNRLKVFQFIREEIAQGRQVYIVYPLIQESEKMDYKDLMDGYESIARDFPAPKYQISIVHGQMNAEDKAYEMQRFVEGKTQIMVATTVIEVGVNVPNASVMIIESSERFGLSQLHQLRGRVGRGNAQSYCILMSGPKRSEEATTRLQTMVNYNDGFKIAEVDLQLRGPGDLMGTQQSGVLQLKIADLSKDQQLLKTARAWAAKILKEDPLLQLPENAPIRKTYTALGAYKNIWNYIS